MATSIGTLSVTKRDGMTTDTSGSGNGKFVITASEHLGRKDRIHNDVVVSGKDNRQKRVKVTQQAAGVFINTTKTFPAGQLNNENITPGQNGETLKLSFYTNASNLLFEWLKNPANSTLLAWNTSNKGTDDLGNPYTVPSLPSKIKVTATTGTTEVSKSNGDACSFAMPKVSQYSNEYFGESEAYKVDFEITIPVNSDDDDVIRHLQVSAPSQNCTYVLKFVIQQQGANVTFDVSPTEIILNSKGTKTESGADAVISVTSNIVWQVSQD